MKNLFCVLAILAICFYGYSQRMDLPGEYIRQKVVNRNNLPNNVQGSPFYNEIFSLGTIYTNDDKSFDASLRYDAYNDEMQMKKDEEIIALLKFEKGKVKIDDQIYEVYNYFENGSEQKGYFINLSKEGHTKLLQQKRKKFVEAVKAQNSYTTDKPPMFKDDINYYLIKDNVLNSVSLSKKKILKLLDDKKKELDAYISEKKLKLNNEDDFIQLINYYNTL